ncbi:hypothetical protein ACEZDG_14855 [Streptacidiphilus sp. N1-1]|uniref:Uncharacterized protein n=2 Tax=Streptacidiphilus alkalitolerans TaxID=3342712 RepID=A0ABV6V9Z5_9ACTN
MDVYITTPGGGMEVLEVPEGSSDLAGFESWRHSVWGSDRVQALGAEFFPALATGDLYVEPGEVERFQRECALLRANLETVAGGVDPHRATVGTVSARLAHIEDAARRAREVGAGVVVW